MSANQTFYIKQESVNIFPCAKPRLKVPQSNRLYESSLTNLIKQLYPLGKCGIVITPDQDLNDPDSKAPITISGNTITFNVPLEFSIGGYYCCIDANTAATVENELGTDVTSIYGVILVDQVTKEIYGQDNEGMYEGLTLEVSTSTEDLSGVSSVEVGAGTATRKCTRIALCLLRKDEGDDSGKWVVPVTSRYNIIDYIDGIDGKSTRRRI